MPGSLSGLQLAANSTLRVQDLHLRTGIFAPTARRLNGFSLEAAGVLLLDHLVQTTKGGPYGRKGYADGTERDGRIPRDSPAKRS